MGRLQIDLLGASFTVQASEDDIYLKKLLSYYTEIIETIKRSNHLKDPTQMSIMAGITLVDELYKEKQKNASYSRALHNPNDAEAERITIEMIKSLEKVLG